ncbi:MAG: bifunctional methylenetetrahydrofolate dehydrogenase/methenyltetrahydrofolate cyclohydrolase FolD [Alphaproteobacteria bacterium]|nr:bifunctional methylenetetrahydrofolate dehydrogenase/methenyltetrahydrofolate cyclohydrolase FolD [Alphaproteobacteria bacterium]
MTATLIDGKTIGAALRARVAEQVAALKARRGVCAGIGVILVGDDPASQIYVRMKGKAAEEAGMHAVEIVMPENSTEEAVLDQVRRLNADPAVHGFLVQFPTPKQVRQHAVIDTIDPVKDIDGLTAVNAGLLISGRQGLVPCTPYGSVLLAQSARGSLAGLNAVVIGRSILVGRPVAQLLINADCTVTTAHSKTRDLPALCRSADILVAAMGKAHFVRGDWIKPGATVIDVGTTRLDLGNGKTKLAGDVAFDEAKEVASAITPVPGGVGPMTIACLLRNAVIAAFRQNGLDAPAI